MLVLNRGLKNDTLGKKGEERRNCRVAGTGYNPTRWKTTKLPIAPLSGSMIASERIRKMGRVLRKETGNTVIAGQPVHSCVEIPGDCLARALRALTRTVRVVVHERYLLPGLVRNIKVSLKMLSKKLVASMMVAYIVDDEIQPVGEVLLATLEIDECSHVVRNILATQVSERPTGERWRI